MDYISSNGCRYSIEVQEDPESIQERTARIRKAYVDLLESGVNIPDILLESFLGYKYRKQKGKLYEKDGHIPTDLIRFYYSLKPTNEDFDKFKKSFVSKYVKNESQLEGVNDEDIHGKVEIEGLLDMYEYLHSEEFEEYFSIYSLKELHKKLYSHAPHPECAGYYRTDQRFLPGTGLNLCESYMVEREMFALRHDVDQLHKVAKEIRLLGDVDALLKYLDRCVELKCQLIWIHPFPDGNGRTVRAFINKLLEDAGLPPIYVKAMERTEYHTAMNLAIGEGDYSAIKAFYRYKICDSIIELDINDRVRKRNNELQVHGNSYLKKNDNPKS